MFVLYSFAFSPASLFVSMLFILAAQLLYLLESFGTRSHPEIMSSHLKVKGPSPLERFKISNKSFPFFHRFFFFYFTIKKAQLYAWNYPKLKTKLNNNYTVVVNEDTLPKALQTQALTAFSESTI